jgi:uncharacterized iron-regulated membrane protein
MVVISMGLVLVAGTILLFVLVFQKMNNKEEGKVAAKIPYAWRACGEHNVALAKDEAIERIEFEEDGITRLITRSPGDQWAVTWVHGCSGEVVGRLKIGNGIQ